MNTYDPADSICYVHMIPGKPGRSALPDAGVAGDHARRPALVVLPGGAERDAATAAPRLRLA